jgi:hypothetical protein
MLARRKLKPELKAGRASDRSYKLLLWRVCVLAGELVDVQ